MSNKFKRFKESLNVKRYVIKSKDERVKQIKEKKAKKFKTKK